MNEVKRIKQLQKQVLTFYQDIEEIKYNFVNYDWDAHHCIMAYATQQIEEYQVISGYDIEIDYNPDIYSAAMETMDAKTRKKYEENEKLFDDFFAEHDPDEFAYNFEYQEVMQVWLNTNTGQTTYLARTNRKDKYIFDFGIDWQFIDRGKYAKQYKKTLDYCSETQSGFWRDYSVHPTLQQRGYSGIDAWDYEYYMGDVNDFSVNGQFANNHNLIAEFQKLILGTSEMEKHLKMFGIERTAYIGSIKDEAQRQDYITALKIAKRHHYEINDQVLWDDMVLLLHKLHKDIHNPFFVCPKNLVLAHNRYHHLYQKQVDKEAEQLKREQAKKKIEIVQERTKRYFDLLFKEDNITIMPLITYEDYEQEGKSMHHCVATYFDKVNSLILSARDQDNNRLATIEINLPTLSITQCRGLQNQKPEMFDTINSIIMKHISEIKKRKLKPLAQPA